MTATHYDWRYGDKVIVPAPYAVIPAFGYVIGEPDRLGSIPIRMDDGSASWYHADTLVRLAR